MTHSAVSLDDQISDIHSFCFRGRTWPITASHCMEQGPNLVSACTTHVEDMLNVLIAGVFTLLCDVLV